MNWFELLEKGFWGGCAAVGFAVLFNVPARALWAVFLLGLVGVLAKFALIGLEVHVVLAAFVGASLVGIFSIRAAHKKHAPPLIFAIPSVIPLVPGIFAYKTMLGIITLTEKVGPNYNQVLADTINNGTKATFIIMALAVGVAIPNLITRKESAKEIDIPIKKIRRLSKSSLKKIVRK
ncbi:MAG: threonine/serine exporter family protein [Bacteroidales bacterium]